MSTRKGKYRISQCAYCNTEGPVTRDHIPPKNLFAPPRPSDLVTVPCCEPCRDGWSGDDEYFRLAVVGTFNAYGAPRAMGAWETLLRSLRRPEHAKFNAEILRNLREVEIRTPAGLYLGTAPVLPLEQERVDRVAQRIVRGLFFHEYENRLPDTHEALGFLKQFGIESVLELLGAVRFPEPKVIGGGSFRYSVRVTAEDPDSTMWIGDFFGRLPFLGFTRRR